MKVIKPGQVWSYRGNILRAKKRTSGCTGCLFENSILMCPDVKTKNGNNETPNCLINDIILVKP